jgi:hypothetical protein
MARWRYQALAMMNQDILLPNPEQPFPIIYNSERIKLEKALKINIGAALLSASWGRFMLAGEQFSKAGFQSIEHFVEAIEKNENEQFRAFLTYLQSVVYDGKNLLIHLKEKNFQQFAAGFSRHENESDFNLKLFIKNLNEMAILEAPPATGFFAKLVRTSSSAVQTLGDLFIYNNGQEIYKCKTLELPWKNNEQQQSCIPAGRYKVVKRHSDKYKDHFHLTNVPGRSMILIHSGNYFTHTLGCILVGTAHTDINADGHLDVVSSGPTMQKLNQILPAEFEILVESKG